ncbi:MAG: hypothetical protein PHD05_07405 [Sphaerochaetaceae bacterium]|nr:hypothetical protein [Sphaerochaetaceae bacterium]
MDEIKSKEICAVVKLHEHLTWSPFEAGNCSIVIVKAQDMLNRAGTSFNLLFYKIKLLGGLHAFLDFDGKIILSPIMPDKMLIGFKLTDYIEMIRICKPDAYLSPDGETYLDRENIASFEIERVESDTTLLKKEFPNLEMYGLVKGSNEGQVVKHTLFLKHIGVKKFVFHAGDYVCRGSWNAKHQAKLFASKIKNLGGHLMVYGVGSKKSLLSFRFADDFVTQSHYVQAFYHKKFIGGRTVVCKDKVNSVLINENFSEIKKSVKSLDPTRALFNWNVQEEAIPVKVFAKNKFVYDWRNLLENRRKYLTLSGVY